MEEEEERWNHRILNDDRAQTTTGRAKKPLSRLGFDLCLNYNFITLGNIQGKRCVCDSSALFATLHVGKAGCAVPLSNRRLSQTNTTIMEPLLVALQIGQG